MNEPIPVRNEFFLGLTLAVLITAVTVIGIVGAAISSLWWLMLPIGAFALLVGEIWWGGSQQRRDEQLAQIVALHELPATDEVDLSQIDTGRWGGTDWDDPRWACDLERDTGLEEGERR